MLYCPGTIDWSFELVYVDERYHEPVSRGESCHFFTWCCGRTHPTPDELSGPISIAFRVAGQEYTTNGARDFVKQCENEGAK